MVDAMLLEWDGVLADTGEDRRESLLRALRDESVGMNGDDYDRCCEGLDVRGAAAAALLFAGRDDPVLLDLIALRASRYFLARLAQGCRLKAGVVRLLSYGPRRSRLAITTRASRVETDLFMQSAELDLEIIRCWTADDSSNAPPAPDIFDAATAHLAACCKVRRDHTVAMVATAPWIRAARAAGIRVLAVGAPAHVAMEADGAVDSLEEVTLEQIAALTGIAANERNA